MALYKYVKAPVYIPSQYDNKRQGLSRLSRLIPAILITLGSVLVANVAWPIISYQLFTAPKIKKTQLIAPIPQDEVGNFNHQAMLNPSVQDFTYTPQILGVDLDYTKARNWFPQAPYESLANQTSVYSISIPQINIEGAQVVVGGEDLDKSLIQYPGTAMPGQLGSPVIFGHSILRQFYNPGKTNPNRYISIFSKIMTLKSGDQITIEFDGITYTYEVKDKVEVQPEDVFILEQRYNNRELKLITCVPEGTYLRRGVVVAQLVDFE